MEIIANQNTLRLCGEFLQTELEQESYKELSFEGKTSYKLFCEDISGINTFFIAWLIGLQRNFHQKESSFIIQDPSPSLSQLIKLYRLEGVL